MQHTSESVVPWRAQHGPGTCSASGKPHCVHPGPGQGTYRIKNAPGSLRSPTALLNGLRWPLRSNRDADESARGLKAKSRRELDDSGRRRSHDLPELIGTNICNWIVEFRVVEDVKKVGTDFKLRPLAKDRSGLGE
jgi:hypothetical protein